MSDTLYVCISLDVEEEGLFSGQYASTGTKVTNVALLKRLEPLSLRLGFPLTLFCAWSVFTSQEAMQTVLFMRDKCKAEIGAHLHHWSTPPYDDVKSQGSPTRTDKLNQDLLKARLVSLLEAGKQASGAGITSFRMGRWDLKKEILPLLTELGIKVDSSICPLRAFSNGPDHFLAPAAPYWVYTPSGRILEAPLTQIPIIPALARIWHLTFKNYPKLMDSFHFFGALSANPVWHSSKIMQLAVKRHYARGGRVLNLFWHSSEMMPGASPNIPDQTAADALIAKIIFFCKWLKHEFRINAITMNQLTDLPLSSNFPVASIARKTDW